MKKFFAFLFLALAITSAILFYTHWFVLLTSIIILFHTVVVLDILDGNPSNKDTLIYFGLSCLLFIVFHFVSYSFPVQATTIHGNIIPIYMIGYILGNIACVVTYMVLYPLITYITCGYFILDKESVEDIFVLYIINAFFAEMQETVILLIS